MNGGISKFLAKEARAMSVNENGYKKLPNGQIINVGWKGLHRQFKKAYMEQRRKA